MYSVSLLSSSVPIKDLQQPALTFQELAFCPLPMQKHDQPLISLVMSNIWKDMDKDNLRCHLHYTLAE